MLGEIKRLPSATLLFVQLAGVLVYPFTNDNHAGRALFAVLGIVILALVVRAVNAASAFIWVAVVLGVPATVLLAIQAITGDGALLPYSSALEAVLYFYAAGALIYHLLKDPHVTRDDLFAVAATFTLLAWAFAYTYVVCQELAPGSFTGESAGDQRTWMELLYLSFSVLTSVGLSDIVPVRPFARGLVMIEMLVGLSYVAMLVSRLVGLTFTRRAAEHD